MQAAWAVPYSGSKDGEKMKDKKGKKKDGKKEKKSKSSKKKKRSSPLAM